MKKKTDRAHVIEVRAKNVKLIREVEISEIGEVLEIRGDAGQGKTTILQTIEAGLRGIDPDMVRNGAESAEISLHLDNALIHRLQSRDGDERLTVTDPTSGKPVKRAKEFLKALCGPQVFRPIDWVRLGGGEARGKTERLRQQRDQLLEAMPMSLSDDEVIEAVEDLGKEYVDALGEVNLDEVDFRNHALMICESIRKACYDHRAVQNKLAENAEKTVELTPAPEFQVKESLKELEEQQEAASSKLYEALNEEKQREDWDNEAARLQEILEGTNGVRPVSVIDAELTSLRANVQAKSQEIASLRAKLEVLEGELNDMQEEQGALQDEKSEAISLENDRKRLTELEEKLATNPANTENLRLARDKVSTRIAAKHQQAEYENAVRAAAEARALSDRYDKLVELFRDVLPRKLVSRMDMPVEGLSVDDGMIKINDVPLHQLGTSEQIRVGVQIAAALNPHTGFVLVDGAESMGRDDLKALRQVAQDEDLQLIMTFVDPEAAPGNGRVVMAAGEMKK